MGGPQNDRRHFTRMVKMNFEYVKKKKNCTGTYVRTYGDSTGRGRRGPSTHGPTVVQQLRSSGAVATGSARTSYYFYLLQIQ